MTSTDNFLNSLLQYHQTLVSSDFVESIMQKIDKSFRTRQWILSIFSVIGMAFGIYGVTQLEFGQWQLLQRYWTEFAPVMGTSIIILVSLFFTWVFNEEFERP